MINHQFKYLGNRQCEITEVSPEVIDECFLTLRDHFSSEWLELGNGNNVLQVLWNRRDKLATNELFSLGFAIRKLLPVANKFIAEKVALIKTNDPKNWNGAIFEILALNAFAFNYKVQPTAENHPGYDGKIFISTDKVVRLSVKNYSISKHHDAFLLRSKETEIQIEKYLVQFNCPSVEILINKRIGYPEKKDWDDLTNNLHGAFIEYIRSPNNFLYCVIGDWGIRIQKLNSSQGEFSLHKKSYTLIVSSPFHKNEEKNLFDKIEEACSNLIKHEKKETKDEKNFVIIHLPKIANRQNCAQWVRDYLNLYPEKPISAVILLQPLVVKDEVGGRNFISNGVTILGRKQLNEDFKLVIPVKIAFPMGKITSSYPQRTIEIVVPNEKSFVVNLNNSYVHQSGHHYYDAKGNNDKMEGNITKVASGIFTHSVFKLGDQHLVFSGRFEPVDELEIL